MAEDDRSKRPADAPEAGGGRAAGAGAPDRGAAASPDEIADADLEKVSGAGPRPLPPVGDRS